jgi:hypothetical protein
MIHKNSKIQITYGERPAVLLNYYASSTFILPNTSIFVGEDIPVAVGNAF